MIGSIDYASEKGGVQKVNSRNFFQKMRKD